jgi:transcriptional regulator PpsR
MGGIIREATASGSIGGEVVSGWLGRSFVDTVADTGADKAHRMVEDTRASGLSAFRQMTQRFPSGRELPMEYTTVLLGGRAGMLAVGKSLQAVAELQSRLISAQQAMERDSWKIREIETRYRLLFDVSTEAIALVRAHNFRLIEANPVALRLLGLDGKKANVAGRDLLASFALEERDALRAMLMRVRENGKAPGQLVHIGEAGESALVRASLLRSEPGPVLLLQFVPTGQGRSSPDTSEAALVSDLVERAPDGFVVIGSEGELRHANRSFLDLVEVGGLASIVGEPLGRWLSRPGADLAVLMTHLRKHGVVRLFNSTIYGEHGTPSEVEISSNGTAGPEPAVFGLFIRDVGRRLSNAPPDGSAPHHDPANAVGRTPLRLLVKDAVDGVERHYIKAALDLAGGNRTAAAELLGLSRQGLYIKLARYGLDSEPRTPSDGGDD